MKTLIHKSKAAGSN